jgi:O-methyltransferase
MLKERLLKRTAANVVGRSGLLFEALGENALLHDWLRQSGEFPIFSHRFELYSYIQSRYLRDEAIDYIEFGVAGGESLLKWAEINLNSGTRLIGFDSFDGLPQTWQSITGSAPVGAYSRGGAIPITFDKRVQIVKGLFSETLRGFLGEFQSQARLVVHIDADLYSSTLYVLSHLDTIMVKGSILIFDEFSNPLHEWRAFRDYMVAFGRSFNVLGAAGSYYTQMVLQLEM